MVDSTPDACLLQVMIDRERRPRSVESPPPYNAADYLGPRASTPPSSPPRRPAA